MYSVESSKKNNHEYINFAHELLSVIFKVALINFKKIKSKFTLDKNFQELFEKNKQKNLEEFNNFLYDLNNELLSIDEYLQSNTKEKKDFKRKDINLDTLIESVNICISFVENGIDDNNLFNSLTEKFQSLIKKGNIANNKDLKSVLSDFNNYIKDYINYMNKAVGNNMPEKCEEKKVNENLNNQLMKKIKDLEKELNDKKIKYEKK